MANIKIYNRISLELYNLGYMKIQTEYEHPPQYDSSTNYSRKNLKLGDSLIKLKISNRTLIIDNYSAIDISDSNSKSTPEGQ